MRHRVGLHRGADVVAFAVGNDIEAFFPRIGNRLCQRADALPAERLVIGALGLDSGNQSRERIDDPTVKAQDGFCRAGRRFAVLAVCVLPDLFRNVVEFRIKSCHRRVLTSPDCLNQPFHRNLLLFPPVWRVFLSVQSVGR